MTEAEHQMTGETIKGGKRSQVCKAPRKVTKDRLRNIALYHLQRYATSAQNLKRVLERRAFKAARHHETDMTLAKTWIDEVVDALVRAGAIDDFRFAEDKVLTMLRKGQSQTKIRAYLTSRGVGRDVIVAALDTVTDTLEEPDLLAARAYAQRRRFGPFRTGQGSREIRGNELAALGRAGFRYGIARKIVEAEDESDLD